MAADPAVRGRRGRDWVLENLDPARVAAGYVEMYGSIAGEGRPAGKLAR
jgi:hypothetical protein